MILILLFVFRGIVRNCDMYVIAPLPCPPLQPSIPPLPSILWEGICMLLSYLSWSADYWIYPFILFAGRLREPLERAAHNAFFLSFLFSPSHVSLFPPLIHIHVRLARARAHKYTTLARASFLFTYIPAPTFLNTSHCFRSVFLEILPRA